MVSSKLKYYSLPDDMIFLRNVPDINKHHVASTVPLKLFLQCLVEYTGMSPGIAKLKYKDKLNFYFKSVLNN